MRLAGTSNSLYASWSEKLVGAEQSDTAILNEVGEYIMIVNL